MSEGRRKMRLEVVTPQAVEFGDEVEMVVAPGIDGYLGVLPSHRPMVIQLRIGALRIFIGDEKTVMALSEGYMLITAEKVIILAEATEMREEIDVERALAAKRRAEEKMHLLSAGDVNFLKAQTSLQRAINRLRVANRKNEEQSV